MTHLRARFLVILAALGLCLLSRTQPTRGDEAAEQLVLATYKVAGEGSTATCIAVRHETEGKEGHNFVVTAGHVLEQMKGDTCTLVARKRLDDGRYHRQEVRLPIREGGRPLWTRHGRHDLAVLPLPAAIEVETLPFDCLPTEEQLAAVRVGDALRLAVFPERAEANAAGIPILRSGSIASHPIVPVDPHPVFFVDTTSWSGDSGGPVIHATLRSPSGGPMVIGIIRGMRRITETLKESRFVERRIHYPLGISEVLHATFLRTIIEKAVEEKSVPEEDVTEE